MRYIYALYCAFTFIVCFLICFPFIIIFGILGYKKGIWYLLRVWGFFWLTILGIRTKIIYHNTNPFLHHKEGVVVVANHQSYLDVALIFRAVPFMTRTLAKFEIAKVPLFGYLYKQMTILVDRSSPASKKSSMVALTKLLKEGESVFVFPEGTFNETNNTMIPFYDGAFRIAFETKTDIIPMLFLDTDKRFSYKGFWHWSPGINRVVILDKIEIAALKPTDIKTLKNHVFNIMSEAMHYYKPTLTLVKV